MNYPSETANPFLGHTNKALNYVVGGWQLSGVLLFQTGPFQTVVAPSADPAGNNFPNFENAGRADVVDGVPIYPADQSIRQWVQPRPRLLSAKQHRAAGQLRSRFRGGTGNAGRFPLPLQVGSSDRADHAAGGRSCLQRLQPSELHHSEPELRNGGVRNYQ